jgi:glutamate formiminotransferase/formiminotetrahydrofolate cyclodeaminase
MDAAPLHVVYEECRKEAERLGVLVTGSEVVGLVPERSLLEAGRYYLDRQGKSPSAPRRDLVAAAVLSLGLNACGPFDAEKKVIERRLPAKAPLASLTVAGLVEEVSRDSPAPGGGSVAALAGSLGAGLAAMVDALTAAKPRLRERRAEMASHGQKAHELRERLLEAVDRDAEAFDAVLAALRLPKGTEAERAARELAVARASAAAAEVPLATLRACREAAAEARFAVERGSPASITDAGVGALAALAGAEGAAMNVLVNLRGADPSAAAPTRAEVERLRREVREDAEAAVRRVFEELERPAR